MKKIFLSLIVASSILFTGCLDTTQEVTINADGSGVIASTNDMSALITLVKQMGGADQMKDQGGMKKMDSTVSLAPYVDSIANLTDTEKQILKKGSLHIVMDMVDEKFRTQTSMPFSNLADVAICNKLSSKILGEKMTKEMGKMPEGAPEMPAMSSIEDYFTTTYSNGLIKKTLNKEKYAKVASDEFLKNMKEAGAMGLEMKATYIINLPQAAKEVVGKNIKLSDDKKVVTIKANLDDFFDNASLLEYEIKY